jgi:polyisoprenoid-binding protein YceI
MAFVSRTRIAALGALTAGLLTLGTAPAKAEWHSYTIDPEHFSVAIQIQHIGYYTQTGLFTEAEGSFRFNEATGELADVVVEIQADSFFTGHRRRDDHVKGPDFLNSGEHPVIRFVMTGAEKLDDRAGIVRGDLTLRGETRPIALNVVWNKADVYPFGHGKYTLGIDAGATLMRSEFGMNYALDGELVGDQVSLSLGFEALRED